MFTEGHGSEVIWGVANYWVSRVTWNAEEQSYHLLGKVIQIAVLLLCHSSNITTLL